MRKETIQGTIQPNGIQFDTFEVQQLCESYNVDTVIIFTVSRAGKKRSSPQNKYYWGVVVYLLMKELQRLGNDVDADLTHEFLKDKFCPKVSILDCFGEEIGIVKPTTTDQTTAEFADYVDRIRAWSATFLGLYIPSPDDQFLSE